LADLYVLTYMERLNAGVYTCWRLRIRWEVVFIVIAGMSLTIGNTIYDKGPLSGMRIAVVEWDSSARFIRIFNRFWWPSYSERGLLPWDAHSGTSFFSSIPAFVLSVLWWLFLSVVIDVFINRVLPRLLYWRRRRG
jgi:hypothetical protein